MARDLKIGELARRVGVTAKAIRFYEAQGVLPAARRGANGYRLYTDDAAGVLSFIKQAAGLGLTLAEIREIVAIRQGGRPPCMHVHQLLRNKALELDRKLADLQEVRRRIRQSLAAWRRGPQRPAAVCPHIERATRNRAPERRRGAPLTSGAHAPAPGRTRDRRV